MKKGIKQVLASGLVVASSFNIVACTTSNKGEVDYSFENCVTEWVVNDLFTLSGATLKIKDKKGTETTVELTDEMIKTMPDMTTAGEKTVTIIYNGKEYYLTIQVLGQQALSYTFTGFNQSYFVGDTFDISNLKLNINYDLGEDVSVSVLASMITAMPDMSTDGTKTIEVTYEGNKYTFDIKVFDAEKLAMLEKVQNFINNYDGNKVASSGIKINLQGMARFLNENVEFNQLLVDINMESLKNIEGYKLYRLNEYQPWFLIKDFDDRDAALNDRMWIHFIGLDNYVIVHRFEDEIIRSYGPGGYYSVPEGMSEYPMSDFIDEAMKIDVNEVVNADGSINIFDQRIATSIYKAISNAIIDSSFNIDYKEIASAGTELNSNINLLKIMQNMYTNLTTVNFYEFIVNDLLLREDDQVYVNDIGNFITDNMNIYEEEYRDDIDDLVQKYLTKIRNSQFEESESLYDFLVELNEIVKVSDADAGIKERFNLFVDGLERQDKHIMSKLAYSWRHYAEIFTWAYGEAETIEEAQLDGRQYWGYHEDPDTGETVYEYRYKVPVENEEELIEKYFSAFKSCVERYENRDTYEKPQDMFNDMIADIRLIDDVIEEINAHEDWRYETINTEIIPLFKSYIDQYVQLYNAGTIADLIDIMALTLPEDATQYQVSTYSMAPTLQPGDIITVRPTNDYVEGDIICATSTYGNYVMTSRLIGIVEEDGTTYYILKGDNGASANPDGGSGYQDDIYYIQSLKGQGLSMSEIRSTLRNVTIIDPSQVVGEVTGVNEKYLDLPANIIDMFQDCADILYLGFAKPGNIDYVGIVEELCERLNVEKEYYVEKFKNGELTLFEDVFDRYVKLEELETPELEYFTALREVCVYMDSMLVNGTSVEEVLGVVHEHFTALSQYFEDIGEKDYAEYIICEAIEKLTNQEHDFNTNMKELVEENKVVAKELIKSLLIDFMGIYNDEEAQASLDSRINYYLTAYLNDKFKMEDVFLDINEFIDEHAAEEQKTTAKAMVILATILADKEGNLDYNELFGELELPNEIKEIDFNTLINETLRDKETYDMLHITDANVEYVTDQEGNIIKEILTVSLVAEYDVLFSELDAKLTLTFEINL